MNLLANHESNYYPFGMVTPGRSFSAGDGYRFGFNGKESDSEIKGDRNSIDFSARLYDPRIGRWLSVDKLHLLSPSWTPYRAFYDNPVYWVDNDGNIECPLKGTKAKNKRDLPGGRAEDNTIVRTSTYMEIRSVGTSPHIGIDYRAPIGTPVYSLASGTVSGMYTTKSGIVILEVTYGDGDKFRFLHLSKYAEGLKIGDKLAEGQIMAYTGNSGGYPAHLHVDATDKHGNQIDPENRNYGEMTNEEFFGGDFGTKGNNEMASLEFNLSMINCCPIDNLKNPIQERKVLDLSVKPIDANPVTYSVTASTLNLRTGAGTTYSTNGQALGTGTVVTATGKTDGEWAEVNTSDGRTGWISTRYATKKSD